MTVTEKPSVKISQGFQASTTENDKELYPIVIGPMLNYVTYANNKESAYASIYDAASGNELAYPNKNTGTISDLSKVAVYFDESELEYLNKTKDSGDYEFRIVNGYKNRIKTVAESDGDNLTFKTFVNPAGTSFPRSDSLKRDTASGDILEITNGSETFTTKVLSILHNNVASSIDSLAANSGNKATQAHSVGDAVVTNAAGDDTITTSGTYLGSLSSNVLEDTYTCTVLAGGSAPSFVVTPDGGNTGDDTLSIGSSIHDSALSMSYEVEVTTGGAVGVAEVTVTNITTGVVSDAQTFVGFGSGNPLILDSNTGSTFYITDGTDTVLTLGDVFGIGVTPSTGRIQIVSQSGIDNVASRVFPGFSYAFSVGALGVKISVADGGDTVITQGLEFTISTVKAIDAVVPVISGTYTGLVDMTYYFEVIDGGLWGESTVKTTSSAVDASGPTIVSNYGTAIEVGNYGLSLTFPTNTQGGLVAGDKFSVAVYCAKDGAYRTLVTKKNIPTAILDAETPVTGSLTANPGNSGGTDIALSGTYAEVSSNLSEIKTETYTLKITKAGATNTAEMTITSASGLDDGVAFIITNDDGTTEFPVNSSGMIIKITDADHTFALNDEWTFTVTKQNLGAKMRFIKSDLQINEYRDDLPGQYAWTADSDNVTINSAIKVKVSDWDSGETALPISTAKIYIEYIAFYAHTTGIQKISSSATKDEIAEELKSVDPDGVLGYAVYNCVINSPNIDTKYLGLKTFDEAGWDSAIAILAKDPNVYSLIIASDDKAVINKFKTHITAMNTAVKKRWRRIYCSVTPPSQVDVATSYEDQYGAEQNLTATVSANPNESTTIYNYFEISEDQGVELIQDNITENKHGIRFLYETDSNGEIVYEDYTITEIYNDSACKISPALSSAVSSASKYELYKIYDVDEQKEYFTDYAKVLSDWKICLVFPWVFTDDDGQSVSGIHLAAAVGGAKSSVYPHQSITNYTLENVADVAATYNTFGEDDLQDLADNGVLIVTQDTSDDIPYIRHQLTTDVSDEEHAELSVGVTYDNVSYYMDAQLADFPGKWNLHDTAFNAVRARLLAAIEAKKVYTNDQIGPEMIDGSINYIQQSTVQKTKIEASLTYKLNGPMNILDIQQTMYI